MEIGHLLRSKPFLDKQVKDGIAFQLVTDVVFFISLKAANYSSLEWCYYCPDHCPLWVKGKATWICLVSDLQQEIILNKETNN